MKKLRKALRRARAGKAEGVHDSRTELRRLRTYVELMGRSVFGHRRAARLCTKLHAAEKSLSKCRDADVMTASLAQYLKMRPAARKGLEPLGRLLKKRRRRARSRLHGHLPNHLPREVTRFLGRGVVHGGYIGGNEAGPALVHQFTHEEIWHQYGFVLAFENRIPGSPDLFHAFRGVCRQLRFALELFGEALPTAKPLARELHELHELQDRAGEMHDHHAAQATVAKAVKRKKLAGTKALEAYGRFQRDERDRLARALEGHAKSILQPRFQTRLARSLVRLRKQRPNDAKKAAATRVARSFTFWLPSSLDSGWRAGKLAARATMALEPT